MSKSKKTKKRVIDAKEIVSGVISVYDLMQCSKVAGKWVKDSAGLQGTYKVGKGYADNHNANFEESGSIYVINEEATKEYHKLIEAKKGGESDEVDNDSQD